MPAFQGKLGVHEAGGGGPNNWVRSVLFYGLGACREKWLSFTVPKSVPRSAEKPCFAGGLDVGSSPYKEHLLNSHAKHK